MILLIDNYDSFVYNIARYIQQLGYQTVVVRNDALSLTQLAALKPTHLIISPGPCTPCEAGISISAIHYFKELPILGICLGHQAIAQAYGATIKHALRPLHGMSSSITHHQTGILQGLKNPLQVGRYHSLIVSNENLPDCLMVTAYSEEGEIMALQHSHYPSFGIQFHPESVLTEQGYQLLKNFCSHPKILKDPAHVAVMGNQFK